MKKLLFFSNLYPRVAEQQRGVFNKQQIESLRKYCPVSILSPVSMTDYFSSLVARGNRNEGSKYTSSSSVHYSVYFFVPKFGNLLTPLTMFISIFHKMTWLIWKYKPDIIYNAWAYPDAIVGTCFAKLFHLKVISKVHGTDINVLSRNRFIRRCIAIAFNYNDAVITVSCALKNKLVEIGVRPEIIHTIYNGIDHGLFSLNKSLCLRSKHEIDIDTKVILYIGNLIPEKGCIDLVNAFSVLYEKQKDIFLIVVGTGYSNNTLLQMVDDLMLTNHVLFTGRVEHCEIPCWMNTSDVIVLPSYNEGVPNVLLEGMACGLPVVSTTVGGIPEIVNEKTGILVEPGDVSSLADALEASILRTWDSEAIAHHVESFNWDDNALKILSLV